MSGGMQQRLATQQASGLYKFYFIFHEKKIK
jgi:hypothetical protein